MRMYIISLTLLILLLLPLPGWSKDLPLFVIQRSTNANEVQYHLRVDDRCHILGDEPVSAIWHRRAERPETTKPLSAIDKLAYGVVQQNVEDNGVEFRLRALEDKSLKATATAQPGTGTCVARVQVEIHAQWAALERVYVQTEEGGVRPKVQYVELFGTRMEGSPVQVTERITP
jgi:Domain of unknown function (DUF4833)